MSLWLTDITIHAARTPERAGRPDEPLDEHRVAEMVLPALPSDLAVVHTLIDGRSPAARAGSTATYRLQRALGLPRSAPVACWSPGLRAAVSTLELLLDTVPGNRCALLVAGAEPTHPLAVGLVWRMPARPGQPSLDPARLPEPGADGQHRDGFLRLLAAAARGAPRARTSTRQATTEGNTT